MQIIEALLKADGVIIVEDSEMEMLALSSHSTPRWILKGHLKNTSMLTELCRAFNIHYLDIIEETLCFIKQTFAADRQLPADPVELVLLPVEGFAQLEILVADFQETDRFQIHQARCTGTKVFPNGGPRNNWVRVQTGGEANYGDLREWVVAQLLALFKIRNVLGEAATVQRLAFIRILDSINNGKFQHASGHIRVGERIHG